MKLDMEKQDFGLSKLDIEGPMELPLEEGWPTGVVVAGTVTVDNLDSRFLISDV